MQKDGSVWRSSTTKQKIAGYSKAVLESHEKAKKMGASNYTSKVPSSSQSSRSQANASGAQGTPTSQKAEANLKNAMSTQNHDYPEVDEFLSSINLSKYKDPFIDNGIEDMDTILELNDEHMQMIGIPLGHKLKILKRIKDINAERNPPQMANHDAQKKPAHSSMKKRTDLEELPGGNQDGGGQTSSTGGGSNLLEGQFNEEEGRKGFLEALEEWRGGGKTVTKENPTGKRNSVKKEVRFQEATSNEGGTSTQEDNVYSEPKKESPKSKNILFAGGGDFNLGAVPTFEETGTKMSPRSQKDSMKLSEKESCWQCYKLFPKENAFVDQKTQRSFCGDECYKKYLDANSVNCKAPGCENRFLKIEGSFIDGKWYCNEDCAARDVELRERVDSNEEGGKETKESSSQISDADEEVEVDI